MSLAKAQKTARKAIESGYTGVCTVIERRNMRNENSKITYQDDVVVLDGQPCKLSFEKLQNAVSGENAAAVAQGVKLFIAPEVEIKPGSKIIIEQNGRRGEYAASSQPAVYASHQEVVLEIFAGWA